MQLGEGLLQSDSVLVVARDVTGTARARSVGIQCLVHGIQNLLVASHAEVVIGAPDSHTLFGRRSVGTRELLGETVDVVEIAVRLVLVLLLKLRIVKALVIVRLVGRRIGGTAEGGLGSGGRRAQRIGGVMVS